MKQYLTLENEKAVDFLCGKNNRNLSRFGENLKVDIIRSKERTVLFEGEEEVIEQARFVLHYLYQQILLGMIKSTDDLEDVFFKLTHQNSAAQKITSGVLIKHHFIKPRSKNQEILLQALGEKDIVFAVGPAGTGKTYLAIAYAVSLLQAHVIKKIIITRPVVEAGEHLGFLPGDMQEKIDPYLRPVYDAFYELMTKDVTQKRISSGEIEIAPLAFMRGRTLSDACVILDEAQNTTSTQMKMFLTRIGENAKMIITGDITQTDLPEGIISGLEEAVKQLKGIDEIAIITFDENDIVRHPLIGKILKAYEKK